MDGNNEDRLIRAAHDLAETSTIPLTRETFERIDHLLGLISEVVQSLRGDDREGA